MERKTIFQNQWDRAKAVSKENFILIQANIKKKEKNPSQQSKHLSQKSEEKTAKIFEGRKQQKKRVDPGILINTFCEAKIPLITKAKTFLKKKISISLKTINAKIHIKIPPN